MPLRPLVAGVCRRIPRPASAEAYDVEEIIVQLRIDGPTVSERGREREEARQEEHAA